MESGTNEQVDFSKVGDTALLVSYFKSFSGNMVSEEIARKTNARVVASKFFKDEDDMKKALAFGPVLVESRNKGLTLQVQKIMRERGIRNVLEMGGGVALERAIALTANKDVRYSMTDYNPDLVRAQIQLAATLGDGKARDRENLVFSQANALSRADTLAAIAQFGGERHVKVSEGMLPYFTIPEREEYLAISRETMPAGSAMVTTDMLTKKQIDAIISGYPERYELFVRISGVTEKALIDNAFADDEHVKSFCEEGGFEARNVPVFADGIDKLYSPDILMQREGVRVSYDDIQVARNRKAWVLTPID